MGGMAPNAVLTTLAHFRDEFETHIRDKRCPAGVCRMEQVATRQLAARRS